MTLPRVGLTNDEGRMSESVTFHTLSVDEETIVRRVVGQILVPVSGFDEQGRAGRIWGPVTMDVARHSRPCCRVCGVEIEKGQPMIRFGFTSGQMSSGAVKPAYIHADKCVRGEEPA